MNMQDIKHKWVERENCFEVWATCSTSPPSPQWGISTIIIPARSLGTATLTMSSLKNSWTRKSLICSYKNNIQHEPTSLSRPQPQTPPITTWNTWWSLLSITNKYSYNKDHIRIDMAMKSSSLCEKNLDLKVKNTRNPFEKVKRYTLDKLSFNMEMKL